MDYVGKNRNAWNNEVLKGNYWTKIVDDEAVKRAASGDISITVTPYKPIPKEWIEPLRGKRVLNLGGGGGQQTVLLSAWGCDVTTLDISEKQLEQDRIGLDNHSLNAELIQGNMTHTGFLNETFDGVINPQSLNFIEDIRQVFREVRRILKKDGIYIFGIANPVLYIFDEKIQEKKLKVKYTLPYSDLTSLSEKELGKRLLQGDTIEFSHTLNDILGGLIDERFIIDGFFSDRALSEPTDSFICDSHIAIRARRM